MKTIRGGFRAAALMGAAASVLLFAVGAKAQNTWPYAATGPSPVLAVVGDIACQPGAPAAGEASGETCTTAPTPYTTTSLWQSQAATANQIEAMHPAAVALLGDLQYQVGRYSDFQQSFDWTYGAFKFLHRPAPGNHEFYDEHGETGVGGYGYFAYYNGFLVDTTSDASLGMPLMATISDPCPIPDASCKAGKTPVVNLSPQPIPRADGQAGHFEPTGGLETATLYNGPSAGTTTTAGVGDGWYSYNLGSWHLISLNIECYTQPGGCSTTGPWLAAELAWLKNDLATNQSACTAAYWHQPTFSATNGITQEGLTAQAFWQLLYQYGADLVLNGHDHLYARYQPLSPAGTYDPVRGIREFIVGSGGETLDPIVIAQVTSGASETNQEDPTGNTNFNAVNLQAYTGDYWGAMALTLNPNGYAWDFESALAGPGALVNGPTLPAPNANGGYSDKGVAACHGPVSANPTPTYLSASCGNAGFVYGGSYHCNVNVGSTAGGATGSITYTFDGGTPVVVALGNGSAQFSLTTPDAGSHTVVIGYEQQGSFAASGPATESFTVAPATTQLSLSPSNYYPGAGSSLTLTASVTSYSAAIPTSGTVTFYANGASIGMGPVNSTGQATLTIPSLAAGYYSFNAQFGGLSPDYGGAGSNYLTIQAH